MTFNEFKEHERQEVMNSTIDKLMTIWQNEDNYTTEVKCSLYGGEIQKMCDKLQDIENMKRAEKGIFYEVSKAPVDSDERGEFVYCTMMEYIARKDFEEMRSNDDEENENYTFTLAKVNEKGSILEVLDTFTK